MKHSFENLAGSKLPKLIGEFLGISPRKISIIYTGTKHSSDFVLKAGDYRFLVGLQRSGLKASLLLTSSGLKKGVMKLKEAVIPLLVVPYMPKSGRDICEESGISWLDLSGNANIQGQGLVIRIEGKPNLFKAAGRPANIFAPKSSRIARQLLIHPEESYTQRQLSQATGLDEGFTSRLVRRLEEEGLIVRNKSGVLRARDADLLLDTWREIYDFGKHDILKGHIPARSGEELLRRIAAVLSRDKIEYAATGLSAAWLLTRFAGFRISTIFLQKPPDEGLLQKLGFREEERGSNTWLVVPDDESVFWGATRRENIRCVHPVQIYLDLKGHPERAAEAAAKVREEYLA